ncbi:hypothetical protein C8J57DRAFT_1227996 [Mycena rebaudengoi]|nr:hypothetical protein C8J57DRAFT_1227996 [Mycena rebaudengoi]
MKEDMAYTSVGIFHAKIFQKVIDRFHIEAIFLYMPRRQDALPVMLDIGIDRFRLSLWCKIFCNESQILNVNLLSMLRERFVASGSTSTQRKRKEKPVLSDRVLIKCEHFLKGRGLVMKPGSVEYSAFRESALYPAVRRGTLASTNPAFEDLELQDWNTTEWHAKNTRCTKRKIRNGEERAEEAEGVRVER